MLFLTVFSWLRLVCNGLNTTKRYRNLGSDPVRSDCRWCGHLGGDAIWHIASFPPLRLALHQRWPRLVLPASEDGAMSFYCGIDRPSHAQLRKRIILADLVVKAYQCGVASPLVVKKLDDCFQARLTKWILCKGHNYVTTWTDIQN